MSRRLASHLSPAPVSTRIFLRAARMSRQFMPRTMRLRSSEGAFFSHMGLGTTPNMAPPSRRSVPSFKTRNSRSPSLNANPPVQYFVEFPRQQNTDRGGAPKLLLRSDRARRRRRFFAAGARSTARGED